MKPPNVLFGDPLHCTYCGALPCAVDHVIPVASYSELPRKKKGATGVRTYACQRCNLWLGAKVFPSFRERALFVNGKLLARASKFARDASWSDEEIATLDDTLRSFVANRQMQMRQADATVSWMDSAGFRASLASLSRIPHLDPTSPKYLEWLADYFNDYL